MACPLSKIVYPEHHRETKKRTRIAPQPQPLGEIIVLPVPRTLTVGPNCSSRTKRLSRGRPDACDARNSSTADVSLRRIGNFSARAKIRFIPELETPSHHDKTAFYRIGSTYPVAWPKHEQSYVVLHSWSMKHEPQRRKLT